MPRLLQVWRSRSARDVSVAMYGVFVVAVSLWLVYGLAVGALPIILANGLSLSLAIRVLLMKRHFAHRDRT